MTDEQLRAWAATQGEAGEAVLRVMRERDEARASDERGKAHLGDMLRITGEACDALAVPNEGRPRFQLPHMARAMRDRAESAERDAERHLANLREAEAARSAELARNVAAFEHAYAGGGITVEEKIRGVLAELKERTAQLGRVQTERSADNAALMHLFLTLPSCDRCGRRATKAFGRGAERYCDAHAPDGCPDDPHAAAVRAIEDRFAGPLSATVADPRGVNSRDPGPGR